MGSIQRKVSMTLAALYHFASLGGTLLASQTASLASWYDKTQYVKYNAASNQWEKIGSDQTFALGATTIYPGSSAPFVDYVWFPAGASQSYKVDASTVTATGLGAFHFISAGGYLWRATATDAYYTNDGTTWSSAIAVCKSPHQIRGMAAMERDIYVATDEGLFRIAPGDIVEGVMPWGTTSQYNGRGMINWQGSLYIPLRNRILRFDPSGATQDIWLSREADMPLTRMGSIAALTPMNNWLIAVVDGTASDNRPSVWAWQEEGWHFLATLPGGYGAMDAYYDRDNGLLWAGTQYGGAFWLGIPDYALNPYTDTTSEYMPYGWLETDRFYGGQLLLDKDFESVTILGDNLSANVHAKVYWQDEGSTAWELLGTADSDGEELRWSTYSTRPAGKWIKLGLLLKTNDPLETPRIRAVVVKFIPMIMDKLRDTVTIALYDYITFPDGTVDTYTRAQQWAHLFSTAVIKSVNPVIYQDPFGTQYEVKIVDWSTNAPTYNSDTGSGVVREQELTLVLEQVQDAAYT